MADAYNRAIGNVSFRGLLDAISPTPIVGDAISGLLGLYDTGKGLLGDYKAAQEKDPRKMIAGMAANTDNYNSGLLNLGSMLPYVTPAVAGMFIGKNSKVWDALKADEAQKMLAAGVPKEEVWSKTGTFRFADGNLMQEVDDSAAALRMYPGDELIRKQSLPAKDFIKHDKMSEAYPEMMDMQIHTRVPWGSKGAYYAGDNSIGIAPLSSTAPMSMATDVKSTTLHEMQHAIQNAEGWDGGASPSHIKDQLKKQGKEELRPYYSDRSAYDYHIGNWAKAENALYIKKLDQLSQKQNPNPSEIFRLSDWYSHSDAIRERLGPIPNKAGAARDEWIRGAASFIKSKALEERNISQSLLYLDLPDLKKYARQSSRQADKYKDGARKAAEIDWKYKGYEKQDADTLYRNAAGEALARLTQSRMNMPMPERLQVYPYDMLDVPQEQLIVRGLLGDAPTTAMNTPGVIKITDNVNNFTLPKELQGKAYRGSKEIDSGDWWTSDPQTALSYAKQRGGKYLLISDLMDGDAQALKMAESLGKRSPTHYIDLETGLFHKVP